jgi:hypothetical protein
MAQPPPAWGEQTPQPRPNGADQPTQPQPQQNCGLPSTQEGWGHVPQGPPTHNRGGSPPPPPRRPRRWYERPEILIPLALVVFLALGFGVYAATNIVGQKATPTSTTQQRHVITGTFLLSGTEGEDFFADDGGCQGTSGYDDVERGLQVTISDQSGTVIGTGALDSGQVLEAGCVFRFEVNNIPVANFYKVAVGRRGEISYSLDQMKQMSWSVELSLGD